jgi:hypothetical protein
MECDFLPVACSQHLRQGAGCMHSTVRSGSKWFSSCPLTEAAVLADRAGNSSSERVMSDWRKKGNEKLHSDGHGMAGLETGLAIAWNLLVWGPSSGQSTDG